MSYLLDKKIKQKKIFKIALGVIVLIILFYFRLIIFNSLALLSHTIFRPVLIAGNNIGGKLGSVGSYFASKNSLYLQNQDLHFKVNEAETRMSNYNSILAENTSLKEILGRKDIKMNMVLSAILSKPNQSPYDTLVIDAGIKQGLQSGDKVFAFGNVPIGRVAEVYDSSAKVVLYSNSGEKTQVVVSGKPARPPEGSGAGGDIFMEVVGRGGGNFEMIIPRDLTLVKGDQVVLPGINPYVVGIVETVISDPRDPFVKALLTTPVNIQELKFVEVEIN